MLNLRCWRRRATRATCTETTTRWTLVRSRTTLTASKSSLTASRWGWYTLFFVSEKVFRALVAEPPQANLRIKRSQNPLQRFMCRDVLAATQVVCNRGNLEVAAWYMHRFLRTLVALLGEHD